MTKQPKVAVITRTKDRPLLLERAIKSVHEQTAQDFVHVIYNDGGDKAAVDNLLDKYEKITNGRVKVVHKPQASDGPDTVLTEAVKAADSNYVAVHDDDDTWHPEFLERCTKLLDSEGVMGVVVRTDKVDEEVLEPDTVKRLKTEQYLPDVKAINLYRQCVDNQMTPITFMYSRSVFDELGGYDESLPVCGDWDFGIRFLQKYDVAYLDPGFALANYHHRKPSGTNNDSVFGEGKERHRYWSNKLMNKYLRQELSENRLGVGYIMSKERYQQSYISKMAHNVMPSFVTKRLKRRAEN